MNAWRKSTGRFTLFLCLAVLPLWLTAAAPEPAPEVAPAAGPEAAVVGLEIVTAHVPADTPYATPTFVRRQASGIIVKPGLVLTSLDPVRDSISVKGLIGSERVEATVEHRGYDAGLALVKIAKVEGAVLPLESRSPAVAAGTSVDVFGHDQKSRSVRLVRLRVAGSVIRKLHNSDVDFRPVILLEDPPGETAPEINGGPVFINGKFLGVYHQGRPSYVLPTELAAHVVLDAADDKYDGLPEPGFLFQPVPGGAHRNALGLEPDENGLFVRRVLFGSSAWQKLRTGDIVIGVNGKAISPEGDVISGEDRLSIDRYFSLLQKGPATIAIRRGTDRIEVPVEAKSFDGSAWKRRRPKDLRPYLVTAGLVFQELDYNLLHESAAGKDHLLRYRYGYFEEDGLAEQVDRDVVLTAILPDPATNGANRFRYAVIEYLNQRRIRNLKHLAAEFKRSQDRFLVLRFLDRTAPVVLERAGIPAIDERIEAQYRVRRGGTVEAAR